jgi:hypothetical protein
MSESPQPVEQKPPAGEHGPTSLKLDKIGAGVAAALIFMLIVGTALKRGKLFGLGEKEAAKMFENLVLTGKVGLVGLFLLLSFINGHTAYIQKDPRGFMAGSIAIAVTSALGGLLVAWNRNRPDLLFNTAFIGALFFFLFAVTREFSGYFAFMSGENLQGTEEKQRNIMAPIILTIGLAILMYMVYLAVAAHVAPPTGMRLPGGFPVELILFIILGSIGEVMVAKQHGESVGPAIGSSVLMFGTAHLLFQFGGFYEELFGGAPVNWNMFNQAAN